MSTGLVAIIRGVTPDEAGAVGEALYGAGFRIIEVPLNSPDPLESIGILRTTLPADCRVGAGTVLSVEQVDAVHAAGGELVVSPNTDQAVIRRTVELGMDSYPGAATPSEAFSAISAGATAIKLFPASNIGIDGMKAWRSVIPASVGMLPVGGVDAANLAAWLAAGAAGAGIGGSLYRPGDDPAVVARRAAELMNIWDNAQQSAH